MVNWQTFIVRIWQEASSGTWRGQIIHLPDQASRPFATLAQAAAFMHQYVPGISPPTETNQTSESLPEKQDP